MQGHTQRHYVLGILVSSWLVGSSLWPGSLPRSEAAGITELLPQEQLPPLAVVTWSESEVTFAPLEAGLSVRLRVTGPDYVYEEWSEGEGVMFQALEDDGGFLPDGVYRYELLEIMQLDPALEDALAASPDPEEEQALKRQWRRDGLWPPPHPRVQQAVFHIEQGQILAPE